MAQIKDTEIKVNVPKTSFRTSFRVSYSDTDQMGFMHHSNYLKYYENARWELFRIIGFPYSGLESDGLIFPVVSASVRYLRPALYDQEISVITSISVFKGASIIFENSAYNKSGEKINNATITVACVRKCSGKPCPLPQFLLQKLSALILNNVN